MLVLILGLIIFYLPHALPVFLPNLRQKAIDVFGIRKWRILYSIFYALGITLIIWGWIIYRPIAPDIYHLPSWTSHITLIFVWVGFVLFLITKKQPGRILQFIKHPVMVGTLLWSLGHLIANGDLASILVFGSFLVYAIASLIYYAIQANAKYTFISYQGDISALSFGTVIFLVVSFWLHGWIFGVLPF